MQVYLAGMNDLILTKRERELLENLVTIGREDMRMDSLAKRMGITYKSLMRMKYNAMRKNGYKSWEGFYADFILKEFVEDLV